MAAVIIILVLIVLFILWALATYNGFIRLKTQVEEAFSTMDVYLKKRYDLVPNLVEVVKGYAKHEAETLEDVISARNSAYTIGNKDQIAQAEGNLTTALKSIFALAESYPDLKANSNFIDLQNQLKEIEEDIANARKYYNGTVKIYNTKVQQFPAVLIANIGNFEKLAFFEIEDRAERENVKVEF